MASSSSSSSRPVITVKQQHQTGDSVITVKQQHLTGYSFITVNQQRQTGDSVITLKQERETGDSVITVKQEHETGDVLITVKRQLPTDDSFITVQIVTLNGHKCYIRVRCDEPLLQQLNMRYMERSGIDDYNILRFIFKGRRLVDDDNDKTANDLGLKDGDLIDVVFHLIGD